MRNYKISDLPLNIAEKIMPEPMSGCWMSGCWIWVGSIDRNGYGFKYCERKRSSVGAHRLVYRHLVGEIKSECLDHLCRVRACVNPVHLEEVTKSENTKRGFGIAILNKMKTHCVNGHVLSEEKTYKTTRKGKTWRRCVSCTSIRGKIRRDKIKARNNEITATKN